MRFGVCINGDTSLIAQVKENDYDARISLECGMWGDWDGTAIKMREVLEAFE